MQAVYVREHGGPEVLGLEELPTPEPARGEVRVRVRAAALNHLDVWVRRGLPGAPFHLPIVPGSDGAGDIDALGEGVEGLEIGQPVMILPGVSCGHCAMCSSGLDHLCRSYGILGEQRDGVQAQFVVVPRANVIAKPERFSYADAAAVSLTFLTAWHMLVGRAELRGGETVLIHAGGSGVGSAGIQIARFVGARVITTASTDEKLALARKLGAHETINYKTEDFAKRVRALTGKRGVDVVFEHVGGETFERSLRCLAWAGRLVTCGATTGALAKVNLTHLFFKSQSILGSTMGSRGEYHQLVKLFDAGYFEAVIDRVLPLARIADAHRAIEDRAVFGKVVVEPPR